MPYAARAAGTIVEALEGMFEGRSRKDLRRLVIGGRVLVNGAVVTDPRAAVKAGDTLECTRAGRPARHGPPPPAWRGSRRCWPRTS